MAKFIDSKIERFHNKKFSQNVSRARDYKRVAPRVYNRHSGEKISSLVKLKKYWKLLLLGGSVFVLFVLALVFLNYRIVTVQGGSESYNSQVKTEAEKFLQSRNAVFIKNGNWLIFSKQKLEASIAKNISTFKEFKSVKRKINNSLALEFESRYEKYAIATGTGTSVVYDDGIVARKLSSNPSSVFGGSLGDLTKIIWQDSDQTKTFNSFQLEDLNKLDKVITTYAPPAGYKVDLLVYGVNPATANVGYKEELLDHDLVLIVSALGKYFEPSVNDNYYKLYINLDQDIPEILARSQLIVNKLPLDKLKGLLYIDMRYENRAFLCYRGSVCVERSAPQVTVVPGTEVRENLVPQPAEGLILR